MRWDRMGAPLAALALAVSCGGGVVTSPGEVNVLTGPRFWTGDAAQPWAEALVISEGRITALAKRSDLPRLIAHGGAVRELPGVVATPGLTDAHGHLLGYGLAQRCASLGGAASLEEALQRVEAFARRRPDDRWVIGRGWDQNLWPDQAWPDADRLEQAVAGRPCALWRVDGHALWVNRTALAAAGIDAATADPPGGMIRRDAAGRPTGVLIDEATRMVERRIPEPSAREIEDALAWAAESVLGLGLTGVHDMGVEAPEWEALLRLAAAGRLPLRVTAYAQSGAGLHRDLLRSGPIERGRLRLAGVKFYADGALGSRGARLLDPYSDDRGSRGLWVVEPAALEREVAQALGAGLQPAIHAIGDAAVRAALTAFERAAAAQPGGQRRRGRVEHVQVLASADASRFQALGVVASMQPIHATSDMSWAENRLGPERLSGAYAWRTLLDAGATLAFGSDFPIEPPDPRWGLHAAVTRQNREGQPAGGWLAEQRLSLAEALAAFTTGAAFAAQQEREVGRLAPGCWCDVTVFDRDIFSEAPAALLETNVVAVVIGGQVMWQPSAGAQRR